MGSSWSTALKSTEIEKIESAKKCVWGGGGPGPFLMNIGDTPDLRGGRRGDFGTLGLAFLALSNGRSDQDSMGLVVQPIHI